MRKIIIIFSCCIVVLLLGFTGYRSYHVWKQSHWLTLAKGFAAKNDKRNELLCLDQLLRVNSQNIEACRLMADLSESERMPVALTWRERVLSLNPKSLEDRLALAQAAVIFQNYAVATNALAGVGEADRNTEKYQSIAGYVALESRQLAQAEAHFSEAIKLDPTNPVPQVNLAVVRLHVFNKLDMAEARITLQRVILNSTNSVLVSQARRELIMDAMHFKDYATALTLSKDLTQQTNAPFANVAMRLNVLLDTKNSEFKPTLELYRRESVNNSAELADLIKWQMLRLTPGETLAWIQTLPAKIQTNQPAALFAAECQVITKDWIGLQRSLQNQNWGALEFSRHAFLARSLRGQGLEGAFQAEWDLARNTANPENVSSPMFDANLKWLFVNAISWKWQSEAEQILWTVVNKYPDDKSAADYLAQALIKSGRTRSLMELLNIQFRRDSSNLAAKNNLAMVAMLLNADELKPYDLAHQVYEKDPTNSSYASTYAFSLYLQGKNADALKVFQQLPPQTLQDPAIAGYCGLVLKATGDRAKAKAYLELSTKAQLLPEERKLFEKAMTGL